MTNWEYDPAEEAIDTREAQRRIDRGIQVEALLASDLGKELKQMLDDEKADAFKAFVDLDYADGKAIRDAQGRYFVAEGIWKWFLIMVDEKDSLLMQIKNEGG